MSLLDKLKREGFYFPARERIEAKGIRPWEVKLDHKNLRVLAITINELIEDEGPQFAAEIENQIRNAYSDTFSIPWNLTNIIRGSNYYYREFWIFKIQLKRTFKILYPKEKITRCRGTRSTNVVLYKNKESLSKFIDINFLRPTKQFPFWTYVPEKSKH